MNWLLLFLFSLALLPLNISAEEPRVSTDFESHQTSRTGTIRLNGALDAVFPLFGPIGEKDWAAGWDPKPVWPANGELVEGMVFTVDETPGRVFWVVTRYAPTRHEIAYANVLPGQTLNRIEIACKAAGENQTDCTVRYAFVGLSDEGNKFVDFHTEEAYAAKLRHWEEAINYRLKTGKKLEHH